jgi:hypothetical protein
MAEAAQVIAVVGPTMRKLASERDEAIAKLAAYERRVDAEKVASVMIEKGVTSEPFERVVSQMEKAAETTTPEGHNQLGVIRAGLELSGPDMGEKIARVLGDDETRVSAASASDFERFIVGDIG